MDTGDMGWVRISWGTDQTLESHYHYVVVKPVDRTITEALDSAKNTLTAMMANTLSRTIVKNSASTTPRALWDLGTYGKDA